MIKAMDLINFIKTNKLEEALFADFDDELSIGFDVIINDKQDICYEFYKHTGDILIRLFTENEPDEFDVRYLTEKEALKMRGLD